MCNQCIVCVLHHLYCVVCCCTNQQRALPPTPSPSGAGTVRVIWSHGQTPPGQLPGFRGKLAPIFLHSQPGPLFLHSQPTCAAGIEPSFVCVLALHPTSLSSHHSYFLVFHPSLLPSLHVPSSEPPHPPPHLHMPLENLFNYLTPPPSPFISPPSLPFSSLLIVL